jgi:hypothetical protein
LLIALAALVAADWLAAIGEADAALSMDTVEFRVASEFVLASPLHAVAMHSIRILLAPAIV